MAKLLNKNDDYQYFMKRSQSWKNLFDVETGFMRPKKNGGWDKPFDPREVNNNFTEGNSWQYSFFVPQDIPGMIEAYGGKEKFEAKLDEMFTAPSATTGREQVDITGLIGQYAHGNEPSHHMAYLYNYIGKPEKTKEKIHYILNEFYKNIPDGLIGNEDCGQMSAWYVLSSMGIYSVTPGEGFYTTATPYFDKMKVNLENKQSHTILKNKPRMRFINSELEYDFNAVKSIGFEGIIPVPVIQAESKAFKDTMSVTVKGINPDFKTYYYLNENYPDAPKLSGVMFRNNDDKQIAIKTTAQLLAKSFDPKTNRFSNVISATFFKKPNDYTIATQSKYTPQYHAGGPEGLLDGILGNENWRKGEWQGYQGQDFEATIDLQKEQKVSQISARFLQDTRAWILMPTKVEYYVSIDNVNFQLAATVNNTLEAKDYDTKVIAFDGKIKEQNARYIKVKAYNFGKLPDWHQGAGYDAYIFIDEITVK